MRQTIQFALAILCGRLFAGEDPQNLNYIQNKGQWNEKVLYRTDFRGGRMFLHSNSFTYLFYPAEGFTKLHPHPGGKQESDEHVFNFHVVQMEFAGSQTASVNGGEVQETYHNYYLGNDPKHWTSRVPLYKHVTYSDLYPGISVKAFSDNNNVRYDFAVAPNADPSQIKLKFIGQNGISIRNGHLYLETEVGEILQQAPYAYQVIHGEKRRVNCHYKLSENVVSFEATGYDPENELIIDPTLVFSTFTGSTQDNWGMSATYDAVGNGYTSGAVFDPDTAAGSVGYPTTAGAFQSAFGGGQTNATYSYMGFDIVVSKFNPTGSGLLYSTYLGGKDNESPMSTIVDNNNNLIVVGRSYSVNYPTTAGAYDQTLNGAGQADIVVTKFNSTGTALVASTFVGGTADDGVSISGVETYIGSLKYNYADDGRTDVIVDANNNVYVASCTISSNFPVTAGCAQSMNKGLQDACVFKLNSSLSSLIYSTYLGGNQNDAAYNLALDANNEVYVTGGTESANFPTTSGVLHSTYGGAIDGFVTHLSANGSTIKHSTFIGTSAYDQSFFIQIDKFGKIYIYGQSSGSYPVTSGVYSNANSGQFIHCMNPTLSGTFFSTVFGTSKGSPDIAPSAFLVDNCQNIYTSGWGGTLFGYNEFSSTTNGLPTTSGAYQTTTDGSDFYFFVLQKNAASLLYATFIGGPQSQEHVDGGTSRFDKQGVIYQAICEGCGGLSDLPTTPTAWSTTNNSSNCNNALIKFKFDLLITIASFNIAPAVNVGCAPFSCTFQNTSANATAYSWNFGDGTTSTAASPTHVYTTPGNYTVTLIGTDTNTCNMYDTAYAYIRVTPNPTVTIPAVPPICTGSTVQLNANSSTALSYTWSPGTALTNTNTANPVASPTVSTQYIVTVKDSFCTASDTVMVTVHNGTPPTIVGPNQLCSGDSVNLSTTTTFSTYAWSTGATTPTIWVHSAGVYSITTQDTGGCIGKDTILITVLPTPVANYSVNAGTGCVPFTAHFNYTGFGASNYSWNFGDGTTSTQPSPAHTYTATGSYTVSFVVTNTTSCNVPDTATSVITVNPIPTLTIATPPPYCIGDTVQMNAVSPTATSYTWIPVGGLSSNSIANPTASPNVTMIYTLTVSDGKCTNSDTVTVKVFPPNITSITTTGQICAGDTVTLTAHGPGISWVWATGQTTPSIDVNQAGSYVVNTVDANGCPGSASIDIYVFYPVSTSTQGATICEGQLAHPKIIVTPPGTYTYAWYPTAGLSSVSGYNPVANPTVTTHYTVIVNNGPCVSQDTLTVNVVPLPKISVTTPHYVESFYGESVEMIATSNYPVTWTPPDYLSCVTCYTTIATPEQNMTYHAVAVNELGCAVEDTVRIEISPSFYVPNSFTPESDGLNDVWRPVFGGYIQIDVWVFDRWGNQITHWTDLNGGWDGTFHGKQVQEDVYVYKIVAIDFQHKELHKSGTITLVR